MEVFGETTNVGTSGGRAACVIDTAGTEMFWEERLLTGNGVIWVFGAPVGIIEVVFKGAGKFGITVLFNGEICAGAVGPPVGPAGPRRVKVPEEPDPKPNETVTLESPVLF